jgi:hypothetical protein
MKKASVVLASILFYTALTADQGNGYPVEPVAPEQKVVEANGYQSSDRNQRAQNTQVKKHTDPMFEVMGEFLYLSVKEEGLEYATNDTSPATGPIPSQGVTGKVHRIKPDFHPGYRVGLGYFFPHRKGELMAQWMHYQGTRNDSASQPIVAGAGLWPDWLDMINAPMAASANARWNIKMNVFDLQVGTWFWEKKILAVKPFAGFRAAWIDQKLDVAYNGVSFVEAPGPGTTTPLLQSNNRSDFAGYGICAGVDTRWKIWNGFSFFANGDVSLLWSRFNLKQTTTLIDGTLRSSITDVLHTTMPVLELMAGFAYDYHWNWFGLAVHVGWEEELWFSQNELNRFIDSFSHGSTKSSHGNLSLGGWNFRLSLSF